MELIVMPVGCQMVVNRKFDLFFDSAGIFEQLAASSTAVEFGKPNVRKIFLRSEF